MEDIHFDSTYSKTITYLSIFAAKHYYYFCNIRMYYIFDHTLDR